MNWHEDPDLGETREQQDLREYQENLRALMELPHFRKFIWTLIGYCKVYDGNIMTGNAFTNFYLGERNIGLRIIQDLHVAPDLYQKMHAENALVEDFSVQGNHKT